MKREEHPPWIKRGTSTSLSASAADRAANGKGSIRESGVGQSKAEFEAWRNVVLVKVTIINQQSFGIWDLSNATTRVGDNLGAVVRLGLPDGIGETCAWVVCAIENVGDGISSLLAQETTPDLIVMSNMPRAT